MSESVETAELDGAHKSGARTDAEFSVIKARPQVDSAPTQTPPTAQGSRKVSSSARAMLFLVAAVCVSVVAVMVSQLVAGSAWEWVNPVAVACVVLAVVGFFAAPRAH
jgi:hypothetical protein